jgi:hypothetical protein
MRECDQVLDWWFLLATCFASSGFQSKRFGRISRLKPLLFSKVFELKGYAPGNSKAKPTPANGFVAFSAGSVGVLGWY